MTDTSGILTGVSISHACASLDQLEAATNQSQTALVEELMSHDNVTEAFALQTCNRVEAYVVTDRQERGRAALSSVTADVPSDVVRELGHEESLKHLLRVGAGLESLVLGEDQILGQVREAYDEAKRLDALGPILDEALTKAIRVGERARTETAINEGVVSIASAAVRLAAETRGLDGATAAVVGVGDMGTLASKHLAGRVDTITVLNRTVSRAESVAEAISPTDSTVEVSGLESLPDAFTTADIVISATGSDETIVEPETLETVGQTLVIDITRPRDIPPEAATFDHLDVYDLDKLESVTEKTRQMRRDATTQVEAIVEEEFERLLVQYKRKRADDVISAMYESAERTKAAELEQAFETTTFDEEQQAVVEAMADSLVSQLLSSPTNALRDAAERDDWTTIHTALQLLDPDVGTDSEVVSPSFLSQVETASEFETADEESVPEGLEESDD